MFAFLFIGLAIGLVVRSPAVRVSQATRPTPHVAGPMVSDAHHRRPSAVVRVGVLLQQGQPVPPSLASFAIAEAFKRGDMKAVKFLSDAVGAFKKRSESAKTETEQAKETPKEEPVAAPASAPVQTFPSPLADDSGRKIPDEEWSEFVKAMRVAPETYSHDKYIGAFAHNKARLAELGVKQLPTTFDEQYKVFASDIHDRFTRHQDICQNYTGDVVNIKGQDHAVTLSGVLGLLKAAGPRNAVHWLEHPEDREKFPNTTDVFLRSNGCF
jgi:hypothetical protein